MNDVIFFFGIIIALVFGYFGWRPKKEKFESNTNDVKNSNSDFQLNEFKIHNKSNEVQKNKDLSQSEIQKAIQSIDEKIKLLISGFDKDLLTEKEFSLKKKELEIKKAEISETYNQKQKEEAVFNCNKGLFEELKNLKVSGLITEAQYTIKQEQLLSSLLDKSKQKNIDNDIQLSLELNRDKYFNIIHNEED